MLIVYYRTAHDISVMVWGCFYGSTLGYLWTLEEGRNNAENMWRI